MLLTAAALTTLLLAAGAWRMLAPPRAMNNLGWMSEGWLAEYRASHP